MPTQAPQRPSPLNPFLKWTGGKRRLLPHLLPFVPGRFNRYYEPFLGGGALFFALQPPNAMLSDANADLITCYEQVRDNPYHVLEWLKEHPNNPKEYFKVRSLHSLDPIAIAGRIIYLTTLSFNGIYRTNLSGLFNVPYGNKTHLNPADPLPIIIASSALRNTELRCSDFEDVTRFARRGDLLYFDPPYTVAHGHNGFLKYNASIFKWADQMRLARVAKSLSKAGCTVIVSNADHPSIHELYHPMRAITIIRPSVMAASSLYRKAVTECVFIA